MNDIQIFESPEFGKVRTVTINDEPWLVGKDVAEALGYSNGRKALADHVDPEDKSTVTIRDGIQGNPNMTIINESGLYSLVLSSKLPGAKKFRRWVTSEVLPSLRKHGAYATPQTLEQMIADPSTTIRILKELQKEQTQRKELEAQAAADAPKVLFAKAVEASKSSILVGELAKILRQNGKNVGQNRLFDWMRDHGYLIRQQGSQYNMPTQRSMDAGWFEIKESVHLDSNGNNVVTKTPKVTGKGQAYFINKFLGNREAG